MKLLLTILMSSSLFGARTLYIDSTDGVDDNPGDAPARAWKSLARVNQEVFQPGDRLLFRSGGIWTGQLAPNGSGAADRPILIGKYGGEIKPILNGDGTVEDTLLLRNAQYWEITELEITNRGDKPAVRRGVHIVLDNFGEAHHVYLRRLTVHDVNGDDRRKDNGGIVWRTIGDRTPSRFIDLRIERCFVYRVDRSGIVAASTHWQRAKWFPSLQVAIRNNVLDDLGGDGIVPWASDGAIVEHNVLSNANRRSADYNAGIWPWSCDNTVVQFNEAYLTHGTKDGQGFDSDWNSRNTLIQYNYSHDNEGGFLLICNDGSAKPDSSAGNIGTVVRYNISQNDRARIFHIGGPVRDTRIYNNTIYLAPGMDVQLVLFSNWNGWAQSTAFLNNIFFAEGTARYGREIGRNADGTYSLGAGFAPAAGTTFDSNLFFGNHVDRPDDAAALTTDPLFTRPGGAERGWQSAGAYRLREGSPAIDSARVVEDSGGRDYRGTVVAQGRAPDRGAIEFVRPAPRKSFARPASSEPVVAWVNDEPVRASEWRRAVISNRALARRDLCLRAGDDLKRTKVLESLARARGLHPATLPALFDDRASDRHRENQLELALRKASGLQPDAFELWLSQTIARARLRLLPEAVRITPQ